MLFMRNELIFNLWLTLYLTTKCARLSHYTDVIMGAMLSQITSLKIVYSSINWGADQSKTSKLRVTDICAGNSPGMGAMVSQITSIKIVYSSIYWGADQGKHQTSASLAFVRGIHRIPVNSPHQWPVKRKIRISFTKHPLKPISACIFA